VDFYENPARAFGGFRGCKEALTTFLYKLAGVRIAVNPATMAFFRISVTLRAGVRGPVSLQL